MENNAIQTLEKEISELKATIEETEKEIGRLFISIHNVKFSNLDIDEIMERINKFEKMDQLISKHKTDSARLTGLLDSKNLIEKSQANLV